METVETQLARLASAVMLLEEALHNLTSENQGAAELKLLVRVELALDRRAAVVARRDW